MSVAPLMHAAAEVLGICESLNRRACLIGGIAVQRWGQPRATQDVDVTVLTPVGSEPAVVDELLATLTPRVPDARQFALDHRVSLVYDWLLGVAWEHDVGGSSWRAISSAIWTDSTRLRMLSGMKPGC